MSILVLQTVVRQWDFLLAPVVGNVKDFDTVLDHEVHAPVGGRLERGLVAGLLLALAEDGQVEEVRMDK